MKVRARKYHLAKSKIAAWHGRQWGRRCSAYANRCICCAAWRFYDSTGGFPTFDEAAEYMDSLGEDINAPDWERPWTQVK